MIDARLRRTRTLAVLTLVAITLVGVATSVFAQRPTTERSAPPPFPFSDPAALLDQLFGRSTPAEQERLAKIKVSLDEERRLGNAAADAFIRQLRARKVRVVTRGREVTHLRELANRIQPLMTNGRRYSQIKVYVALSDETDARSFPGGTLIFFRGLLDFVENEAALVGVMGHELSHLDRGHQLRHLRQMKLAQTTFSNPGARPQQFMQNGLMLMKLFARPFRPEDEAQADHDGATWAYQLGYDPREMARLFRQWHEREKDRPTLPTFLRSHPNHIDRYEAVMQLYAEMQRTTPKPLITADRR